MFNYYLIPLLIFILMVNVRQYLIISKTVSQRYEQVPFIKSIGNKENMMKLGIVYIHVIPTLRRPEQEELHFETGLGSIVRPCIDYQITAIEIRSQSVTSPLCHITN